jgi:hypothetical protein
MVHSILFDQENLPGSLMKPNDPALPLKWIPYSPPEILSLFSELLEIEIAVCPVIGKGKKIDGGCGIEFVFAGIVMPGCVQPHNLYRHLKGFVFLPELELKTRIDGKSAVIYVPPVPRHC